MKRFIIIIFLTVSSLLAFGRDIPEGVPYVGTYTITVDFKSETVTIIEKGHEAAHYPINDIPEKYFYARTYGGDGYDNYSINTQILACIYEGKWGAIDKNGKVMVDFTWDTDNYFVYAAEYNHLYVKRISLKKALSNPRDAQWADIECVVRFYKGEKEIQMMK